MYSLEIDPSVAVFCFWILGRLLLEVTANNVLIDKIYCSVCPLLHKALTLYATISLSREWSCQFRCPKGTFFSVEVEEPIFRMGEIFKYQKDLREVCQAYVQPLPYSHKLREFLG